MLIKQDAALSQSNSIERNYLRTLFLLCLFLMFHSQTLSLYGENCVDNIFESNFKITPIDMEQAVSLEEKEFMARHCKKQKLSYYLYIADFVQSFIEIPTSNVSDPSSTISSIYLAGRAPIYNIDNAKVGTCSASFLCMQNADGIYTDISNYLSVDNGLIVSWFTPTTLINLELDTIVNSMVTECIVNASTKIGFNPFYGKTFNLVVSSDDEKIYFKFTKI